MSNQQKAKTERVTYFGSFIPYSAKRLPANLNFENGYLLGERNLIIGNVHQRNLEDGRIKIYDAPEVLAFVRDISARRPAWIGEDPAECYTGEWELQKGMMLPSEVIEGVLTALRQRDSAEKQLGRLCNQLNKHMLKTHQR